MGHFGFSGDDLRRMSTREVGETIDRLLGWTAPPPIVPPANPLPFPRVETAEQLVKWCYDKTASLSVVYYTGNLAAFREEVQKKIAELQRLQDLARPSKPRPSGEAHELTMYQRDLELTRMAAFLAGEGVIYLAQRRDPTLQTLYIATRAVRR